MINDIIEKITEVKKDFLNKDLINDETVTYQKKGLNTFFNVECVFLDVSTEFWVDVDEFEIWLKKEYKTTYNSCISKIDFDCGTILGFEIDIFLDLQDFDDFVIEYLDKKLKTNWI